MGRMPLCEEEGFFGGMHFCVETNFEEEEFFEGMHFCVEKEF